MDQGSRIRIRIRDQDQGSGSRIRIKDKDQGSRFLLILTVATSIVRPLVAMFLVKPQAQVYARCCCGHLIIFFSWSSFSYEGCDYFWIIRPVKGLYKYSECHMLVSLSHVCKTSKTASNSLKQSEAVSNSLKQFQTV